LNCTYTTNYGCNLSWIFNCPGHFGEEEVLGVGPAEQAVEGRLETAGSQKGRPPTQD
jgi:hypothetical protein